MSDRGSAAYVLRGLRLIVYKLGCRVHRRECQLSCDFFGKVVLGPQLLISNNISMMLKLGAVTTVDEQRRFSLVYFEIKDHFV